MSENSTCEELARRVRDLEAECENNRRAREEMDAIFEMSLAMICIADIQTATFLRVNPAFTRILGYAPQELLARPFLEFNHPDDVASTRQVVEECLRRGEKVFAFENRYRHKDGSYRWLRWNSQPVPERGITYAVAVDITETKEVEAALRKSEEKFRNLVERISDVIFEVDARGDITYVSPVGCKIWGGDLSDIIGKNFITLVHPEDREQLVQRFIELQQGIEKPMIYRFVDKSGRLLWGRSHSSAIWENGRFIGARGTLMDITSQKETEESLEESEKKYRLTFDASPDAVNINRLEDGLYLDINDGFTRLTGYTREDVIGKTSLEIDIWNDPADRQKLVEGLRKDGFYENLEAQFKLKDGSVKPALMSARVIALKGMPHIISITRSIAALKQAEAEKAKLQEKLAQAQKIESIGRLAGGVAHDFNNMLGVILGHTEMILDQVDPAQPIYAGLAEIQKAAHRSAELTKQLLAFARKQTISPRVLELNDTVTGMLKMLGRLIGEDIDLAWIPGAGLWPVKMDPAQVDQILANLCVNARDAIAGAGKITIETGNAVLDEHYCADRPGFVPGDYVVLAVSDNGCGMDKPILEQLFEPFFTTKPVGRGTGLGLPTIYGIVKQNNGFINVYSEPGRGTTVKLYLPRYLGRASMVSQAIAPEPVRQGRETVLLVEDEPSILDLGRLMLEKLGYRVLASATPGEALAMAETHCGEIDLLMTDVVMPEMNGRDLARHLLSLYPNLKRLFMSGYTANVIAHHGVLDEGVHFIQKPFSYKELADKVRGVLDAP